MKCVTPEHEKTFILGFFFFLLHFSVGLRYNTQCREIETLCDVMQGTETPPIVGDSAPSQVSVADLFLSPYKHVERPTKLIVRPVISQMSDFQSSRRPVKSDFQVESRQNLNYFTRYQH